jgi:hypothetical protein
MSDPQTPLPRLWVWRTIYPNSVVIPTAMSLMTPESRPCRLATRGARAGKQPGTKRSKPHRNAM